jgi:hypothetical protein
MQSITEDLHGMSVREAKERVNTVLSDHRKENIDIIFIVGQGRHSPSGEAALQEAVSRWLAENDYNAKLEPSNPGRIRVRVREGSAISRAGAAVVAAITAEDNGLPLCAKAVIAIVGVILIVGAILICLKYM